MARKIKEEALRPWRDLALGCAITEPGSAKNFKTGDWRSQKPVMDHALCIKCGLCYIYCPDMSLLPRDDGFFEVNLDYCKGCGICAHECPKKAIQMVEEVVE
ncbi:MAG: 4Fe-4S binding protein [Pseudomonadota bacterium]